MDLQSVTRITALGAGLLSLFFGLYLGYVTYDQARSLLHNPAPLEKWLVLRNKVHEDPAVQEKKSRSLFHVQAGASLFSPRQFKALSGYIAMFMGLFFLWILGKLAIAFFSGGSSMLMRAASLPALAQKKQRASSDMNAPGGD